MSPVTETREALETRRARERTKFRICFWGVIAIFILAAIAKARFSPVPTRQASAAGQGWHGSASQIIVPPTTIVTARNHEWNGVEIPQGLTMRDNWGSAPLDIMLNGDPQKIILWPKTEGYHDYGIVTRKDYRMSSSATGFADVTCVFSIAR